MHDLKGVEISGRACGTTTRTRPTISTRWSRRPRRLASRRPSRSATRTNRARPPQVGSSGSGVSAWRSSGISSRCARRSTRDQGAELRPALGRDPLGLHARRADVPARPARRRAARLGVARDGSPPAPDVSAARPGAGELRRVVHDRAGAADDRGRPGGAADDAARGRYGPGCLYPPRGGARRRARDAARGLPARLSGVAGGRARVSGPKSTTTGPRSRPRRRTH